MIALSFLLIVTVAVTPHFPSSSLNLQGEGTTWKWHSARGFSESALTAYADAVSAQRPATRNLYFDLAELELVLRGRDESLKKAAALMRRIGFPRILWGSDGPKYGDAPSRESWTKFQTTIPLKQRELRTIAGNVAPYMR